MASSLDQLISLAPPPKEPKYVNSIADFTAIEASLGTRLPADFKLLLQTYGSGSWTEFYWVMNPFDPRVSGFWFDPGHHEMGLWRELRRDDPELIPYPVWPDTGGLLIWGGNENGGRLFWLTEGDPDRWPTLAMRDRTPEFDRFDQPCTDLLMSAVNMSNPVLAEFALCRDPPPILFSSW